MECKYWIERSLVARLKIEGVSPERCAASWSSIEYFSNFFALFHNFLNLKKKKLKVFQFSFIVFTKLNRKWGI